MKKEEQEKSRKRVEMKHDREYRYDARNKREVSSASEMLATKKRNDRAKEQLKSKDKEKRNSKRAKMKRKRTVKEER